MHHGHADARRRRDLSRARRRPDRPGDEIHRGDRRSGYRAGARGAPPLPATHGRGEPATRRLPSGRARRYRSQPAVLLRGLSGPARAAPSARRQHERGRAADARDRARAHVLAEDPAGGRAVGRPGADSGHPRHRQDSRAQGAVPADGPDGRAELQPGDQDRRSRLHHRPRTHRVRRPQHAGAARERAGQEYYLGV